jgi:alkylated DNA repair protein (DNA oxidative demethylase)
MRGQVARRRVAHFGWRYGYATWRVEPGPPLPEFLGPLRARAAALAGGPSEALAEVLVTEYPPGAAIGWHRDAPQFGDVVGVSLRAPCRLRFRHAPGRGAAAWEIALAPRSAYHLRGAARWAWQHSIPAVTALRYSVTFRTLRAAPSPAVPPPR